MKFIELKKHLLNERPKTAYLLMGDDSYLLYSAINMFCGIVKQYPELNLSIFGEKVSATEIISACEALPLMNDFRVVQLNDYNGSVGDFQQLEKYLHSPNPSTVLVFKVTNLTANYNKLLKYIEAVDCNKLDSKVLNNWIDKQVKGLNSSITLSANNLLIKYCNASLTRISSEVIKLASAKFNEVINDEDIVNLVSADTEYKIFELAEAIAVKENDRALEILKNLLYNKNAPVALLGMLYSHFRRLLFAAVTSDTEQLPRYLNVKEYAVKMALKQSKMYSPKRLKKICEYFHKADFDFKTGLITDKMALDVVIMQILNES